VAGEPIGTLDDLTAASTEASGDTTRLLSPADLQAIKACGVTFARSMIERVIEERAAGDASRAAAIRGRIGEILGTSLRNLRPGSPEAADVKKVLIAEGLWSQYLEVGIGPDAEVFTKAPPMASVGQGATIGLHPVSKWNNPEPEVVLAVNAKGVIRGVTLGNDVNLRDVEGRSALLLGKAKDNNASAAIGPMIRLFDDSFSLDDVRQMTLTLTVTGLDGFQLEGSSSMAEISRDPADLAAQTMGRHHQYPDGFMLYCGTMFSPVQDRDGPGQGFTHHLGDVVTIETPALGSLTNTVRLSTQAPEWTFGTAALMRNLAERGFL
jgi:fumarylacetoacetate (FAA) hydrolase family protein